MYYVMRHCAIVVPQSFNMKGKEKLICGDHSPPKNTHIGCYRSYKMFRQCFVIPNLTRVLPINYYNDTNNTSSLTKSTFISRTFFFFKTVLLKPIWLRENIPLCKIFSVQELIYMPSIQITIPQ